MIERGQIPLVEPVGHPSRRSGTAVPSSRSLSLGIMVVGLGIALMTIISIAGESPEVGIGVGGAIAVLGGAFIVRAVLVRSEAEQVLERRPGTMPERPLPPPPD